MAADRFITFDEPPPTALLPNQFLLSDATTAILFRWNNSSAPSDARVKRDVYVIMEDPPTRTTTGPISIYDSTSEEEGYLSEAADDSDDASLTQPPRQVAASCAVRNRPTASACPPATAASSVRSGGASASSENRPIDPRRPPPGPPRPVFEPSTREGSSPQRQPAPWWTGKRPAQPPASQPPAYRPGYPQQYRDPPPQQYRDPPPPQQQYREPPPPQQQYREPPPPQQYREPPPQYRGPPPQQLAGGPRPNFDPRMARPREDARRPVPPPGYPNGGGASRVESPAMRAPAVAAAAVKRTAVKDILAKQMNIQTQIGKTLEQSQAETEAQEREFAIKQELEKQIPDDVVEARRRLAVQQNAPAGRVRPGKGASRRPP